MTKSIPLTQGKFALVDDEDYDWLMQWKWFYGGYARRANTLMHRLIMQTPEGMATDHINGDRLDNRRENLRVCTNQENSCNRGKQEDNTSGHKGVWWNKKIGKWQAQIKHKDKRINLGLFDEKSVAADAYDNAARELHGGFARTNF